MEKWDARFIELAECVATWSKDPAHKVGAVVVSPDRRQMSMGYNGFPKGIADLPNRLNDKDFKNELTVHAEHNAILNAQCSLSGWTLYTTRPPCVPCALAIMQSGVTRVVSPTIDASSRWGENQRRARHLLIEADVVVVYEGNEI